MIVASTHRLATNTWVSSPRLYLFILQMFTLSLLQFDFILEMREKNVEKMLFRSLHCVQFWQRRKNTVLEFDTEPAAEKPRPRLPIFSGPSSEIEQQLYAAVTGCQAHFLILATIKISEKNISIELCTIINSFLAKYLHSPRTAWW